MKITKVDIMMVDVHAETLRGWKPIVCRVYTDEGIYGDGEAAMTFGVGQNAAFGMIKDLSELIIGMNPLDNEVIWEKLYKTTFWAQNGGPVVFSGISAIDMALWDIKGKYFNVPVYTLLGGKKRSSLRCYASQLQYGWGNKLKAGKTTEDYIEAAKNAINDGYDAVKYDFLAFDENGQRLTTEDTTVLLKPKYLKLMLERLSAVRDTVGNDVDIIIENHSSIDTHVAMQLSDHIRKYNILYFEEPVTPTPKINKAVYDYVHIPIAQGERIYTRWGFMPYFENNSVQLIQPDIGNCGGITEVKKICDMAYTYDVGVQMHVCSSPLSTAAALQLECVIPNFAIHEHHIRNLQDHNRKLCVHDYQPQNGQYLIPDLPGLGNELSEYCFKNGIKITVE